MKTLLTKRLSLVLLICMLFSMLGTACNNDFGGTGAEDTIEGPIVSEDTSHIVDNGGIQYTYQSPEGEAGEIEVGDNEKKLTFYWLWEGFEKELSKCDIWIWYDDP